MEFNINNYVKVKLTEEGEDILRERNTDFKKKYPDVKIGDGIPRKDSEGYCKFQLWDLMSTFGAHISLGCIPPFETVIIIEETRQRRIL